MRRTHTSSSRGAMRLTLALACVLPVLLAAACYPDPDVLRGRQGGGQGLGGEGQGSAGRGGGGGASGGGATGQAGAGGRGGAAGGGGGASGGGSTGTLVMPDASGRIAKTSNSYGIQGSWYVFSDGIGPDGL